MKCGWMPQSRKALCTFVPSSSRAEENFSASPSQVMLCDHHGERKQSHHSLFLISESHSLLSSGTQCCKPGCSAFQLPKWDKIETCCRNSFTALMRARVLQKPPPLGQPHANRTVAPKIPTILTTGWEAKFRQGPAPGLKVPESSSETNSTVAFAI